ncbi:MAG: hypothetical protein IJU53_04430, partial [Thermoguttaceae bacterium]|nr:hypothetical protein [Thermoguttaceae bacterium]
GTRLDPGSGFGQFVDHTEFEPPLKGEVARSAGGVSELVKIRPASGTPQTRFASQPPFQVGL